MAKGRITASGSRIRDLKTERIHRLENVKKGRVSVLKTGDIHSYILVDQPGSSVKVARIKRSSKNFQQV